MYIDEEICCPGVNQQNEDFQILLGWSWTLEFGSDLNILKKLEVDEDLHRPKSSEIYNRQT